MDSEIKRILHEIMDAIKEEFSTCGIAPRQFSRLGGDKEYAEWEIVTQLVEGDANWDGWTNYDEITQNPLFIKAVRWQAAYNIDA